MPREPLERRHRVKLALLLTMGICLASIALLLRLAML